MAKRSIEGGAAKAAPAGAAAILCKDTPRPVNVRSGPGIDAPVVAVVQGSDWEARMAHGAQGGWYAVRKADGWPADGWVLGELFTRRGAQGACADAGADADGGGGIDAGAQAEGAGVDAGAADGAEARA